MINGIYIKNYQSLREVSLTLGKFTVIVGSTNVGKSAVMRALRSLVENRRGDSFVSDGAKECQVSVSVGDKTVTWYKPYKKAALYYIGLLSEANKLQNVSQANAIDTLGLRKVDISKVISLMLNFQNQLDPPFLLTESDIVKSKVLGEITNASLLLTSINILKRWHSANSSNLSIRAADLAETQNKLQKYSTLLKLFETANLLIDKMEQLEGQARELSALSVLFVSATEVSTLLTKLLHVHNIVYGLSTRLSKTYAESLEIARDRELLVNLTGLDARIAEELNSGKQVAKKLELLRKLPNLTSVEQIMNQLTVLAGYNDAIQKASSTVKMLETESASNASMLKAADEDVQRIRLELKICPLCESPLVKDEIHNHQ